MAQKILVIDDEETSVVLIKSCLIEKGYKVIVARDGEEGLQAVKEKKPDLIVLDVQMPKMNGYEFMTELKSLQGFTTTPVIMLTGNETMQDVFKLEGVKDYFVKPVKIPEMVDKIIECLGPKKK